MKIFMLCYEYPPIGGGGAKVVSGLISELVKMGHQVDLVTMHYKNLQVQEKIGKLHIYRVKCFRMRSNICTPAEMLVYLISALPVVFNLCKKNNYNINHTHFIFPDGLLAYVIKKIFRLPYIVTAHGSDVPGYNPDRFILLHKFLKPFWKIISNNAESLVIPSKNLDSLVKQTEPHVRTTIIPNGINLNKFSPSDTRENKILLVTRMFERKGVQYFIDAISNLNHGFSINIVGDGPYLETLKNKSKMVESKVNFWGYLDNNSKELRELYEQSKIFVFTSEAENFPVVLLEAMISGLAIITTNDNGCAEVVGDTAILVKPKDSAPIKEALLKLIDNPDLIEYLGKSARKRAEEKYSWTTVTNKYLETYTQFAVKPNLNPQVYVEER